MRVDIGDLVTDGPDTVTIPRAQHEALMAAAKATCHSVNDMLRIGKISEATHCELVEADHTLRAAGIP